MTGANSTEFEDEPRYKVIYKLRDLLGVEALGGTHAARKVPGASSRRARSRARAYGEPLVRDRHRHRYEVNQEFLPILKEHGLSFTGMSPDKKFVEIVESTRTIRGSSAASSTRSSSRSRSPAIPSSAISSAPQGPPRGRSGSMNAAAEQQANVRSSGKLTCLAASESARLRDRPGRAPALLRRAVRDRVAQALASRMARKLKAVAEKAGARIVFKSSFDKANRTRRPVVPRPRPRRGARDPRRGQGDHGRCR